MRCFHYICTCLITVEKRVNLLRVSKMVLAQRNKLCLDMSKSRSPRFFCEIQARSIPNVAAGNYRFTPALRHVLARPINFRVRSIEPGFKTFLINTYFLYTPFSFVFHVYALKSGCRSCRVVLQGNSFRDSRPGFCLTGVIMGICSSCLRRERTHSDEVLWLTK
jgi:hypothetical protein